MEITLLECSSENIVNIPEYCAVQGTILLTFYL